MVSGGVKRIRRLRSRLRRSMMVMRLSYPSMATTRIVAFQTCSNSPQSPLLSIPHHRLTHSSSSSSSSSTRRRNRQENPCPQNHQQAQRSTGTSPCNHDLMQGAIDIALGSSLNPLIHKDLSLLEQPLHLFPRSIQLLLDHFI